MAKWQEENEERAGGTVEFSDAPVGHFPLHPEGARQIWPSGTSSRLPVFQHALRVFPAGLAKSGSVVSA